MKISVVCAMEEEIRTLLAQLETVTSHEVAGKTFYKGHLYGHDVTLVESGIGKVQAGMTTAILLAEEQPDVVINTGSAGGIGAGLNIGDVVVSSEVAYHDAEATAFGYLPGQLPQQPQRFESDQKYVQQIVDAAQAVHLQPKVGLIVTGDQFVASDAKIEEIKALYPEALSCEMEGAAIGQVATQFKIPFVVIRAMSDVGDGDAGVTFDEFIVEAGQKSAAMLLNFLKNIQ